MSERETEPRGEKVFLPHVQKGDGPQTEPTPTTTPSPAPVPTDPISPTPTPTDPAFPGPTQKVAIDPITRIEGHLRIEAQINNGQVADAWSAGMMFRGIELLLPGRDPRDAWVFTQRICGV